MESNITKSLPRLARAQKPPRMKVARRGSWLSNLRVGQKLALLAVAFSLPVAATLPLLISQQLSDVTFSRHELDGSSFLQPLEDLQTNLWKHASAAIALKGGDENAQADLDQAVKGVESAIAALKKLDGRYPSMTVTTPLEELELNWTALKQSAALLSPRDLIGAHTAFDDQQLSNVMRTVTNNSNLVLDPELASYYSMVLATQYIPEMRQQEASLRELANTILASGKKVNAEDRITLAAQVAQAEALLDETLRSTDSALAANPALKSSLGKASDDFRNGLQPLMQALRELVGGGTIDRDGLNEISQRASVVSAKLLDTSQATLQGQVHDRVARLQRQQLLTLAAVGVILLLAILTLATIARAITRPLNQLAGAARSLGNGDLSIVVPVNTTDEIGVVAGTFNDAVSQLREVERRNALEREEAARLQQNIGEFLDVTMDIAEGDFTKRGRVTEDVLGNVVDSINLMIGELEQVLRNVREASHSVNVGADSMFSTTDDIVRGSETTAQQAERVAQEVQDVLGSIRQMAEVAQETAQTAQLALNASQQGRMAVESTLGGMQNIRREVQGISKRIKGLGDRSLEIQEIVDTISRITRQTNMLALNAAIEAAGAGEAGGRFAIVADEVRKLAESSSAATGRIATLIKNVQAEIQEVVVSVEDGTREVESGYRVAGSAGERLEEIAQLAQRSAELSVTISEATQQQVHGVEQVGEAVGSISNVAQRARQSVNAGREAADRLRMLAAQLDEQLARFRLSE